MDNKYYTPEIEDLYAGYECEILWNYNYLSENEWCNVRVLQGSNEDFDMTDYIERIAREHIRTKYLDKDDIESLGWFHRVNYSEGTMSFEIKDNSKVGILGWFLGYNPNTQLLQITHMDGSYDSDGLRVIKKFDGIIPSINELKKIMKWIGIL